MAQQKPNKTADESYKRTLFYDNGIRFVKVKGKLTGEYKPPTPVMKTGINTNIQSSAGLVGAGTSHYVTTMQLLFTSKEEYAEWVQYIGSEHKFYDEKGTIYLGIVTGDISVSTEEAETKYLVTVSLALVRKQDFEFRATYPFIDIDEHWAREYIDEMQQKGIVASYSASGEPSQYFQPDAFATRAHITAFMMRTYKQIEKVLRGY